MIQWNLTKLDTVKNPRYTETTFEFTCWKTKDGETTPYDGMGIKRWAKHMVDAIHGTINNPIIERNSKDYMWYSRFFKSVTKIENGVYRVVVQEPLDKRRDL